MEDIEKTIMCLPDSGTTHTILSNKNFFSSVTLRKSNIQTISSPVEIIDGSRNATIILPNGTILHIEDALSSRSKRNLLSFKDVRCNGYHLKTIVENCKEYLCITSYKMSQKIIHEKLEATYSEVYLSLFELLTHTLQNPEN